MHKQNRIGQDSPLTRRDKVRSTSDYRLPGLAGETAASPLRQKQKTLRRMIHDQMPNVTKINRTGSPYPDVSRVGH